MLDRCDRDGLPAYLEATSTRNRDLYLRLGFAVLEQMELPGGGPLVWRMWRGPAPAADGPENAGRRRPQGSVAVGLDCREAMQEMVIYGVSFDMVGKQPIVLLKTRDGNKFLPIWIGHPGGRRDPDEAAGSQHAAPDDP